MSELAIRVARREDLPVVRDIERAAGGMFADLGMQAIADEEPSSVGELDAYRRDGRAWVAVDDHDRPVAYVLVDLFDGNAHVAQISVHPDAHRRRIGATLLDQVASWACDHGCSAVTLTTFSHVPWNAPYYARCGFRVVADDDVTPGLAAVLDEEAARGLDRTLRVCMRRDL